MTEIYTKRELGAKAELALMGIVTPVRDKDNVIYMIDYINRVLGITDVSGEEIYAQATEFIKPKMTGIVGISACTMLGGECRVVNIVFKDHKDTKFKLDDQDGVLTYVYNYDWPDCSELGYCFFEKKSGNMYHRIA